MIKHPIIQGYNNRSMKEKENMIFAEVTVDHTKPGTITAELVTAEDDVKRGVVDVVGSIGGEVRAVEVAGAINAWVRAGVKELEVRVTSYGGCLYSALAIYDALEAARGAGVQVTGRVYGVAASAATIILMGCERIELTEKSELMIHEPATCIYGKVSELQADVDSLRGAWARMCDIYAARTGKTVAEIVAAHTGDVWYTAEQAVAYGWADGVFSPVGGAAPAEAVKADATLASVDAEEELPAPVPQKRTLWDTAVDIAARFGLCPPRKREAAVENPLLETEKLLAEATVQQERMAAELDGMRAMLAAAQEERAAIAAERDAACADRQADIEREVAARVASMGLSAEVELPAPVPGQGGGEGPGSESLVRDSEVAAWLDSKDYDRVISYACRSAEANKQVSRLLR